MQAKFRSKCSWFNWTILSFLRVCFNMKNINQARRENENKEIAPFILISFLSLFSSWNKRFDSLVFRMVYLTVIIYERKRKKYHGEIYINISEWIYEYPQIDCVHHCSHEIFKQVFEALALNLKMYSFPNVFQNARIWK